MDAKIAYHSGIIFGAQNKSIEKWKILNGLNCRNNVTEDISAEAFDEFFTDHINEISSGLPVSNYDCTHCLNNALQPLIARVDSMRNVWGDRSTPQSIKNPGKTEVEIFCNLRYTKHPKN